MGTAAHSGSPWSRVTKSAWPGPLWNAVEGTVKVGQLYPISVNATMLESVVEPHSGSSDLEMRCFSARSARTQGAFPNDFVATENFNV
jgi:hypothetical protein